MDWKEIQLISRNPRYDIESHTMTHPGMDGDTLIDWMAGLVPNSAEQVRWELAESQRVLTENLGRPICYPAGPLGLYNESLIRLAKETGYRGLFTIDDGVNGKGYVMLRLRRTMVHGGCNGQVFAQILHDGFYRACEAGTASQSGTIEGGLQ